MAHAHQEDAACEKTVQGLIARIKRLDCGQPILTDQEAKILAEEIWPYHPDNPGRRPEAENLETTLRWLQEERKIEQSYLAMFLASWFAGCTFLVGASTYALSLTPSELRIGISVLCAVGLTVLSGLSLRSIWASMRAQSYRHFQLVVLTKESSKYPAWGFGWRLENDSDRAHRRAFASVTWSIFLVMAACWLLPLFAWMTSRASKVPDPARPLAVSASRPSVASLAPAGNPGNWP
jgi:hypothetical protein